MRDEVLHYLFSDFLYKYKPYFSKLFTKGLDYYLQKKKRNCKLDHEHNLLTCQPGVNINKQTVEQNENNYRKFLSNFVKKLEPRIYDKSDSDIIQDQYEEVFEVVFAINGHIGVGYRLFNEIFYGKSIVMSKTKRVISPINDYSCISNKSSEFLYTPIEKVEALAIRREDFNTLMNDPTGCKLKPYIAKNYKYTI